MAKPISILTNAANVNVFDKVPRRLYSEDAPPLKRKFGIAEKWLIVEGAVSFTAESPKQTMTASAGDVIILPDESIVTNMRFAQPTYVKQYIDNEDERIRISNNIKVNYLIIQTILEICNQFEDYISVPFDSKTDWIFECAKEGNLYEYTDNWDIVDMVIQNFVGRTGIHENVWYGKRRIKTGLKYKKPLPKLKHPKESAIRLSLANFDEIESLEDKPEQEGVYPKILTKWISQDSIDEIDFSAHTPQGQGKAYKALVDDPLDLKTLITELEELKKSGEIDANTEIPQYYPVVHSLENLLIFVARAIKEEELGLLNKTFPTDIVLRQPRNSGEHLNKDGMPHDITYGNELVTIIKHLFWVNSVGFDNRMELLAL